MNDEMFSWYKEEHRAVINSLVDWVLEQESFGSSLSLLVTIKERLNKRMFVELVNIVVAGRVDTGFVMPSMESYMPQDFFTQEKALTQEAEETEKSNHGTRVRRQVSDHSDRMQAWWAENLRLWGQTETQQNLPPTQNP